MLMLILMLGCSGMVLASQQGYQDDFFDYHFDNNSSGGFFDNHFDNDYDDYHKKYYSKSFSAKLDGYQEVPAVLTDGKGRFQAKTDGYTLYYKLTYKNLSGDALAAHIHLAQPGANGGLLVWLCDATEANAPACPADGEKVEGTLTADDVQEIAAQGVEAGDFEALLRAMSNGVTYVNVHTEKFPAGEIRGYIKD